MNRDCNQIVLVHIFVFASGFYYCCCYQNDWVINFTAKEQFISNQSTLVVLILKLVSFYLNTSYYYKLNYVIVVVLPWVSARFFPRGPILDFSW